MSTQSIFQSKNHATARIPNVRRNTANVTD